MALLTPTDVILRPQIIIYDRYYSSHGQNFQSQNASGPEDAQVLLSVMQILFSYPIVKAERRWRTEHKKDMSLEEFEIKFPRRSEDDENFINLVCFWETVGSLTRKGLLKESLAFDTLLDSPPWSKAERIFKEMREWDKQPHEGESAAWVASRAREWAAKREKTRSWKSKS
jgi:hypothetical protein